MFKLCRTEYELSFTFVKVSNKVSKMKKANKVKEQEIYAFVLIRNKKYSRVPKRVLNSILQGKSHLRKIKRVKEKEEEKKEDFEGIEVL